MTLPQHYTTLTFHIRYNKNISNNAKVLFSEIEALTHKEGYCWATNKYFSQILSASEQSITKWVKELVSEKIVFFSTAKTKTGTVRILTINDEYFEKDFINSMPTIQEDSVFIKENIQIKPIIKNQYVEKIQDVECDKKSICRDENITFNDENVKNTSQHIENLREGYHTEIVANNIIYNNQEDNINSSININIIMPTKNYDTPPTIESEEKKIKDFFIEEQEEKIEIPYSLLNEKFGTAEESFFCEEILNTQKGYELTKNIIDNPTDENLKEFMFYCICFSNNNFMSPITKFHTKKEMFNSFYYEKMLTQDIKFFIDENFNLILDYLANNQCF